MLRRTAFALALFAPLPALASGLPPCAKTGAASVMFNGKPALKLSDVAACPAGTWEIIPGMVIEGEPMVHFNTGVSGCTAAASPNVFIDGKAVVTAGDPSCPQP